jgi:phosphomevalonate kinase
LPGQKAPWFDASALRHDGRKLGLGSSAAILVASLAAMDVAPEGDVALADAALASRVFLRALEAHRKAQGGGSGIDVAASCHGGVLRCERRRSDGALELVPHRLPPGLVIEVWASPREGSTPELLSKVRALRERDPRLHGRVLSALGAASEAALAADDAAAFTTACARVMEGLDELGHESGAPIVTPDVRAFAEAARAAGGVVVPSGAGGGDVVLYVAGGPSCVSVREAALRAGLLPLDVRLGPRGVHAAAGRRHVEYKGESTS